MVNMPEGPQGPSQKSTKIRDAFTGEADRASDYSNETIFEPEKINKPTLQEYVDMCKEFLDVEDILPDKLLADRLRFIDQDSHLREHFPEGYTMQLAVIPFTINGTPFSADKCGTGIHARNLLVDNSGKTVSGFTLFPNYINKFLPDELKECSFQVGPYSSRDNIHFVELEEREAIKNAYRLAFEKLQQFFRQ